MPPNAFFGMRSLGEAARKYLNLVKRKQTTKQIAEGLEQGGFPHQSKNFYNTLYTVLTREQASGELIRIGSEWAIPSWFPGRRPKAHESASKKAAKKASKKGAKAAKQPSGPKALPPAPGPKAVLREPVPIVKAAGA